MCEAREVVKLHRGLYDFHCHLRSGPMMEFVARTHYAGGARVVLFMPNLQTPILVGDQAVEYERLLAKAEPRLAYLKTIYLTENTSQNDIKDAADRGVTGAKLYPLGVTTNSENGVRDINGLRAALKEMENRGIVLNVHGESTGADTTPFTAEEDFLPVFEKICSEYPRLKVVFEHCTTKKAVDLINSLGSNVAATITLHHLQIDCNDWIGKNYGINYCKPVAKLPGDREYLRKQVVDGNRKFFLGTDSAPHTENSKRGSKSSVAGVYTGINVAAYAAHILEGFGALDNLQGFCQSFGATFYNIDLDTKSTILKKSPWEIPEYVYFRDADGSLQAIAPFMAQENLSWKVIPEESLDSESLA